MTPLVSPYTVAGKVRREMWDRQLHPHSDAVIVKRIRDAADAGEIEAEKLDQVTKTGNPIWRVDFKKTLAWYLKTYVTKKGKA